MESVADITPTVSGCHDDSGDSVDIEATSSGEDKGFDAIVGHIEDIIMSDTFIKMKEEFLQHNYQEFENIDENKLSHMTVFKKYNNAIEKHLEMSLKERIPGFQMDAFVGELAERQGELDGEIFEILYTFSDFVAFKEMILDYKAAVEGCVADLSIIGKS